MMQLRFKDQAVRLFSEIQTIKRISVIVLLIFLTKGYAQTLAPLTPVKQQQPPMPLQNQPLDLTQCRDLVRQVIEASGSISSQVTASVWAYRYQLIAPYKVACYHQADFLSFLGAAELYTGRIADAQDTLERTLMLNPAHRQALMDYAQLLNAIGQPMTALDLNRQLLQREGLPSDMQSHLEQRQQRWSKRLQRTNFRLSAAWGYDSNLNTAPDLSELTLSDGLNSTLFLDESSQPIEGQVLNLSGSVEHMRLHKKGIHYWQANVYTRTGIENRLREREARHDQQQLDLLYKSVISPPQMKVNPQGDGYIAWGVTASQFWYNSDSLYQSVGGQLEVRRPVSKQCYTDLELQLSRQHYPQDRSQEALEYLLQPGIQCLLTPQLQFYGQVGIGFNKALNQRVGGDRQLADLLLSLQYKENTRLWRMSARHAYTQDSQGYSPLLDSNKARKVRNTQFSGQLRQDITSGLGAELNIQRSLQQSNIQLFDYSVNRFSLGLDWRF